jgi:hypothetical protein
VPFIPYITTIVRDRNSRTSEVVHANHMPGFDVGPPLQPAFLGAESRFIPDSSAMSLMYRNGRVIFDFSKLATGQEKFIGYIYGGIEAQPGKSKNSYVYRDWKKYDQLPEINRHRSRLRCVLLSWEALNDCIAERYQL